MSDSASQPTLSFDAEPAFRKTQSPDTEWTLGAGLREATPLGRQWKEDEQRGWKTLNFDKMEKPDIYRFLTSAITPRPIAFVSTLSASGEPNLAPFSYFSMVSQIERKSRSTEPPMHIPVSYVSDILQVSHNPPMLSVSFTLSAARPKDTRENIKATKEFVVNIISEPFVEAASATSIEAPADIDEWAVSGLTPTPSDIVKPPRVRESAVSLECELYHFLDIPAPDAPDGPPATTLVVGRIRRVHVRRAVLAAAPDAEPGTDTDSVQVDPARLRAVSRLG
ncbi:hypothetical protein M0805_005028, partial [Coniferiporia weirii]